MKLISYISVFSLFFFCSFIGQAQKVDLRSEDLIKPNQRTIFKTIDNHLKIASYDRNQSKYNAVSKDCKIISKGDSLIIRSDSVGKISIYITVRETGDTVKSVEYNCEPAPLPSPLVAGKSGGEITFEELSNSDSISMVNKTDLKKLPPYSITGFTIGVYTGMGLEYYKSESDKFTPEQMSVFNKMISGSKFLIKDILVKNENAEIFNLDTINFKLKKSN